MSNSLSFNSHFKYFVIMLEILQVWGLKMEDETGDSTRTGSMITANPSAPLYDRWSEMMTRLQLWVEVQL